MFVSPRHFDPELLILPLRLAGIGVANRDYCPISVSLANFKLIFEFCLHSKSLQTREETVTACSRAKISHCFPHSHVSSCLLGPQGQCWNGQGFLSPQLGLSPCHSLNCGSQRSLRAGGDMSPFRESGSCAAQNAQCGHVLLPRMGDNLSGTLLVGLGWKIWVF